MPKRDISIQKKMPDGGKVNIPKYVAPNGNIRNLVLTDDLTYQISVPDESVRNWHLNYINSPKYRERLIKMGYTNPDKVIKDRTRRLRNTNIISSDTATDLGSYYNQLDGANTIYMDYPQIKRLNTFRDDILAHEFGHVNNSSTNIKIDKKGNFFVTPSNTSLNENEEEYIANRNVVVGKKMVDMFRGSPAKKNNTYSNVLGGIGHDYSPAENKSDIDALRYMLEKEGLYKAGNEDFTPELLEKAKSNKVIQRSFNASRVFKKFTDKDIIDIMNNIASNTQENNNSPIYARNGAVINNKISNDNTMPNPPTKSPRKNDEERVARIVALSKQWGVPTNSIFTKVKYQPTSIYQSPSEALPEYREYFTFDPQGKIARSVIDRYENRLQGYSGSAYNFQSAPIIPQPVETVSVNSLNDQSLIPPKEFSKGGSLNFKSKGAYKKWLAYGHIHGNFESTPGNQKVSIKGKSHKVRHAAYGDSLQPIHYDNPYVVSDQLQNPIPYQPYTYQIPNSEPLRQGLQNVSNYFSNQPAAIIDNNASLQGPSFYQSDYVLNSDNNQVSQSSYQPLSNPIGDIGQPAPTVTSGRNKYSVPNIHLNTAGAIMGVAGLVNATADQDRINKEYSRQVRRNAMVQPYNPFPYGTGSSAIFENGGELSPEKAKTILREGRANGKKLTKKQKGYFGFIAEGGTPKANFGMSISNYTAPANDYEVGQTYDLTPDQISHLRSMGYDLEIQ